MTRKPTLTPSSAAGLVLAVAALAAAPAGAAEVHVYSSLPLRGPSASQARDIVRGIRLALGEAGGRAGSFDVRYTSLDDSTRAAGYWDPSQVVRNARRAARDRAAVLYLGDFNSGASALSIPILNTYNVPQISPSNTYNGLTTSEPGTERGEPRKYYPTGKRTYVRLPPRDTVQGAALATQMRDDGCTKVGIANDKDIYGFGLALLVRSAALRLGIGVTKDYGIDQGARHYRGLARYYRRAGANCFFFGGVTANHARPLYRDVHKALPKARLYGGDGICESGFTRHVSAGVARLFLCSVAALPVSKYPGGEAYLGSYAAMFGERAPDPYGIYGYEAMKLGLDTIAALGDRGSNREAVRAALFATRDRTSVLGTYSIDRRGDTTLRDYGMYRVARDGYPAFRNVVVAQ